MTTQRWSDNDDATLDSGTLVAVLGVGSGNPDKKTTLGAIRTWIIGQFSSVVQALLGAADAAEARTALELGDGADGEDGASAYELAVANGFEGTVEEWLASLVGPAGADGADGADGSDASVTNANVNAAIGTDPAATRAALGVDAAALPVTTYTGNATIDAADRIIVVNSATDCTLTVPSGLTQATIEVWTIGAGKVTLVQGSGVTLRRADEDSLVIALKGAATLRNFGSDVFGLVGKMEPA